MRPSDNKKRFYKSFAFGLISFYLMQGVSMSSNVPESIVEISRYLAQSDSAATIEEFLSSILTPAELETLASRWELVKLLDQGVSQRNIAKQLHLSLCKITRGSKELKKENSVLKKAVKTTK